MSGALQAVYQNLRSFSEPPPTVIGQAYGGGFYGGQIGVSGTATHYLVVAPKSSGNTTAQYKTSNTTSGGAYSVIDGPANSSALNNSSHPAAQFCESRTIASFTDWYLPAQNELEVLYFNLKPTTTSNLTSSGINPNAVPARASNYTSGNPAQTSASAFRTTGAEFLTQGYTWSSTEAYASNARAQNFDYGTQANIGKTNSYTVRAIRRVAV